MSTDTKHKDQLSQLSKNAQLGDDQFASWARRAATEPDQVYAEILQQLGNVAELEPWSAFAKIYHEDTPEHIFTEQVAFATKIFDGYGVRKDDLVLDVACGTGAVARLLNGLGYSHLIAFDRSAEMLNEARQLSTAEKITFLQSDIANLELVYPAKAMVWYDFSSSFAMTGEVLGQWLNRLLANLEIGGILIFDVRVNEGWQIDFFKQKVTAYETENFQRLWVNLPNFASKQIRFDIYLRTKLAGGGWGEWQREQMLERMWTTSEVEQVISKLKVDLLGTYGDDFKPLPAGATVNLVKFVLRKTAL
jgi:SAM-dependent methyltransferase